ncbi:hypothetical protein H9W95_13455 [Flavobacterium lindanitolerans]|nr:hypothetical protein [Flavobacterium lindanitolerans]
MNRIFSALLLLCLFSSLLNAQSNKEDIDKLLKDAGYTLDFVDNQKGLKIILKAREASKRIGYKEGLLKSGSMLTVFICVKIIIKK